MTRRVTSPARQNFRTVMPRRRQRDTGTSHTPSQPQLRVGELTRLAAAALATTHEQDRHGQTI